MDTSAQLKELKRQIGTIVRRNSDRGFVPYSGCNRICSELNALAEEAESHADRRYTFDVHLLVLLETVKLISHADTSSGMVNDVIWNCLQILDQHCQTNKEDEQQYFFKTILKAVNNKAFKEWEEYAYELLRSVVHLVNDTKQAGKVYAMFPILGPTYSGEQYPSMYLITYGITLKLEGEAASNQYLMDHIEIDELRVIAVENALQQKKYELAEQLCKEAMEKENRFSTIKSKWAQFLERVYTETLETEKLIEIVRWTLDQGHTSYYSKLKELYLSQGLWEEELKISLLGELSERLFPNSYAVILDEEKEYLILLGVIQSHPYLIEHFGKRLAESYSEETSVIYEKYIFNKAADATDRRGYKGVCKQIIGYSDAVSKEKALLLLEKLCGMYPRRPAMLDELMKLEGKLIRGTRAAF